MNKQTQLLIWQSRQILLFDSNQNNENENLIISKKKLYQLSFGSIPMKITSTNTKIHKLIINKNHYIVISKLFKLNYSWISEEKGSSIEQIWSMENIQELLQSYSLDDIKQNSQNMNPSYTFSLMIIYRITKNSIPEDSIFRSFLFLDFYLIRMIKLINLYLTFLNCIENPNSQEKVFRMYELNSYQKIKLESQFLCSFMEKIHSAPKFPQHYWEYFLTSIDQVSRLGHASILLQQISLLSSQFDTAEKNFFFSRVLTATLAMFLGWITTTESYTRNSSKNSNEDLIPINKFIQILYGWQKGYYSKILVIGKDEDQTKQFVFVLSYFLRFPHIPESNKISNFDGEPEFDDSEWVDLDPDEEKRYSEEDFLNPTYSLYGDYNTEIIPEYYLQSTPELNEKKKNIIHQNLKNILVVLGKRPKNPIKMARFMVIDLDNTLCEIHRLEFHPQLPDQELEEFHIIENISRDSKNILSQKEVIKKDNQQFEIKTSIPEDEIELNPQNVIAFPVLKPSSHILQTLQTLKVLEGFQVDSNFALTYLEQRLDELYSQAKILSDMLSIFTEEFLDSLTQNTLISLGFRQQDFSILFAIAQKISPFPQILQQKIKRYFSKPYDHKIVERYIEQVELFSFLFLEKEKIEGIHFLQQISLFL
ncbi:hypothetical protein M0811_07175 [Anaeramoeba ignava]|uniref:Uncharacterized protein n=1 Tax=Anaeramoeba ignava TaxID=1746090 RepID=A0A9Q0LQV4_ANAIG|nr:hypothetical protein M0811_07175 [Anaeramoeba ignava]